MVFIEEFNLLLKARCPLVYITTFEEDRLEYTLRRYIQINGKFLTTYQTQLDYRIDDIYDNLIAIPKVREKIKERKLIKKINVQNKIINLIFS